jgi:hypothetical protein
VITFSSIGNNGHLGNQMFQYAALRGISAKNGYEWSIPPDSEFGTRYSVKSSLYSCFKLDAAVDSSARFVSGKPVLSERFFHFDDALYNSCPDEVDLNGYFQTEKYFIEIENEIRKDFCFKEKTRKNAKEVIGGADPNNVISIHVRRGDYVSNDQFHTNLSAEYYLSILSDLAPPELVIVCSDDIGWCEQNMSIKNVVFSSSTPYTDMCIMSMCRTNIIANSSFSWWSAWLNSNKNKEIYCPKQWFGPAYRNHDLKDLIPDGWNIV